MSEEYEILVGILDRLAALEGAQQAHIEEETAILQLTRRVAELEDTNELHAGFLAGANGRMNDMDRNWGVRIAQLERIARLAHAERQTYRAWQTTDADGWPAYKAARAALDGALDSLSAK